jgi:hypothetical protein
MRIALPALIALLCVACAAPPGPVAADGWSIERKPGAVPALVSTSTVHSSMPLLSTPLASVPIRSMSRGRWQVSLAAEDDIAAHWKTGAPLLDANLARALAWLERLGRDEARGLEVRLTLVGQQGARRHVARHRADKVLVVDLLVPAADAVRSRSAVLESALATGLHEVSHALRADGPAGERHADELRASLVAACFRIEGLQRGDRLRLPGDAPLPAGDFTRIHSARASQQANALLRAVLGSEVLDGSDLDGRARLQAHCRQQLD